MARVYSFQYLNETIDRYTVQTPAIASARVLEVSRNGIGMQKSSGGSETVSADVKLYQRLSQAFGAPDYLRYFIITSTVNTLTTRTYTFEVGPTVTVNDVYVVTRNAFLSTSYTVQPGDTTQDVRDGIQAAVDAYSWGVAVTCAAVGTDKFTAQVNSISIMLTPSIVIATNSLYQTGRYVTLTGNDYLIENHNTSTTYYTLGALAGSYAFASLSYMPTGIVNFINNPAYYQTSFSESVEGTTNITGYESPSSLGAGKYKYDELTQTLTFSEPLQPGEYIKMLYK
jgi:hypothetical protein